MTEQRGAAVPAFHQESGEGPLFLADISGYSAFLRAVTTAHADDAFAGGAVPEAYRMMSSLLGGIVESITPPFTLSKIEGDAVFAFAHLDTEFPRGPAVLDCIHRCYADFRTRLAQAGDVWTCTCEACSRADNLDLKFILHAGRFVVHEIAGSRELSGPEVVMAHRLLKNRAAEAVRQRAYALLTEAAVSLLEVPTEGAVQVTDADDDHPTTEVFVYRLG